MLDNGDDMLAHLSSQVNPKVVGLERVKKAILLSLASGGDKWGDRGRNL
jgi:DNA replicative helicase MCM subunit Mcm2 (Cdc46/Mcm family)